MNVSNNVSSITAHQTWMNNNANNVANVNSERFVPTDTRLSSQENSVVAKGVKSDDTFSQNSQTDLSKELTDQMMIEKATASNTSAIKAQDEMLGSLLDTKA